MDGATADTTSLGRREGRRRVRGLRDQRLIKLVGARAAASRRIGAGGGAPQPAAVSGHTQSKRQGDLPASSRSRAADATVARRAREERARRQAKGGRRGPRRVGQHRAPVPKHGVGTCARGYFQELPTRSRGAPAWRRTPAGPTSAHLARRPRASSVRSRADKIKSEVAGRSDRSGGKIVDTPPPTRRPPSGRGRRWTDDPPGRGN